MHAAGAHSPWGAIVEDEGSGTIAVRASRMALELVGSTSLLTIQSPSTVHPRGYIAEQPHIDVASCNQLRPWDWPNRVKRALVWESSLGSLCRRVSVLVCRVADRWRRGWQAGLGSGGRALRGCCRCGARLSVG